jgi:DNA-binding response OmpR family regulator
LKLLRSTSFDVVLMDLQMPRMDGGEAVAHIRAGRAGQADIPVIALTADVIGGADEALLQIGFDAVQAKPIDAGALIKAIFEVLDAAADANGAGRPLEPGPDVASRARPVAIASLIATSRVGQKDEELGLQSGYPVPGAYSPMGRPLQRRRHGLAVGKGFMASPNTEIGAKAEPWPLMAL